MPDHCENQISLISQNQGGFSLLEVLIAIAIFTIGFAAVWKLQIQAVNSNATGRDLTEAATLAASSTEDLLGLDYFDAALDDGSHTTTGQPPYSIAWNVNEDDDIAGLKKIALDVDWGHRNVMLVTYVVDHP